MMEFEGRRDTKLALYLDCTRLRFIGGKGDSLNERMKSENSNKSAGPTKNHIERTLGLTLVDPLLPLWINDNDNGLEHRNQIVTL